MMMVHFLNRGSTEMARSSFSLRCQEADSIRCHSFSRILLVGLPQGAQFGPKP